MSKFSDAKKAARIILKKIASKKTVEKKAEETINAMQKITLDKIEVIRQATEKRIKEIDAEIASEKQVYTIIDGGEALLNAAIEDVQEKEAYKQAEPS
jgi:hypothetical protein